MIPHHRLGGLFGSLLATAILTAGIDRPTDAYDRDQQRRPRLDPRIAEARERHNELQPRKPKRFRHNRRG